MKKVLRRSTIALGVIGLLVAITFRAPAKNLAQETQGLQVQIQVLEPEVKKQPTVKIDVQTEVRRDTPVHVKIIETGPPARSRRVTIEPKLPEGHMIPGKAPTEFTLVAAPGIYTIRCLTVWPDSVSASGEFEGLAEAEARVEVFDPRPLPPAPIEPEEPQTLDALVARWVSEVESVNPAQERREIARAARKTAQMYRDRRVSKKSVVDRWAKEAFKVMGPAAGVWNSAREGDAFFKRMELLFIDNTSAPPKDRVEEDVLLESVAAFIETSATVSAK